MATDVSSPRQLERHMGLSYRTRSDLGIPHRVSKGLATPLMYLDSANNNRRLVQWHVLPQRQHYLACRIRDSPE